MLKCKTIKHILFWPFCSVHLKNNVLNPRHRALRCGRSSPSQRQKRRSSTSLQDSEGQRWHVHAFTHEGVGLCSTSFHMSPCSVDKVGWSTILKKCLLSASCRIFGKSCMLARFIRIAKVLTWGRARLKECALQFSWIIESWQPVLPRNWVDKQPSENASNLNEAFSKGQIPVSTHSFRLRLQHLRCWRQPNLLVCVRHVPACEHYWEDILICLAKAWTPLLALWLTTAARISTDFCKVSYGL